MKKVIPYPDLISDTALVIAFGFSGGALMLGAAGSLILRAMMFTPLGITTIVVGFVIGVAISVARHYFRKKIRALEGDDAECL